MLLSCLFKTQSSFETGCKYNLLSYFIIHVINVATFLKVISSDNLSAVSINILECQIFHYFFNLL